MNEEKKNNMKNPVMNKIFSQSKSNNEINTIETLKEKNFELLNKIKTLLKVESHQNVHELMKKISASKELSEIIDYQTEITSIIEDTFEQLHVELENTKRFLNTINDNLEVISDDMVEASQNINQNIINSLTYNENLKIELHDLSSNSKDISNIEALRSMIDINVNRINSDIEEKHIELSKSHGTIKGEQEKLLKNFQDVVNKIHNKIKTLEEQSQIDSLTGIYNRRIFQERLNEELKRFNRYKHPFSLIFFDIDHFKKINDQYGHLAGDKVLKVIAQLTQKIKRESDILARFGGEEFVIILPATKIDNANVVAKKIKKDIENIGFEYEGEKVMITVSIGVSEVKDSDIEISHILARVDSFMYEAKMKGRNTIISDHDVDNNGQIDIIN